MSLSSRPPSALSPADFVATYGGVYEHSQWVAEELLKAGLSPADDNAERLSRRMAAIVEASSDAEKLKLLRLHPELAGKLNIGEELTESSKKEQSGARLDQCTPEEFQHFQALNDAYRARFGFPFIIAVTGLTRADILKAFAARVENSPEQEFKTALEQVHRIAEIRIEAIARSWT